MAKNNAKHSETPKKQHYLNPLETWWGKVIIWVLLMGMVGAIIIGFIVSIISGNA